MSNVTITIYRRGPLASLTPHPDAEAVTIELADDVRVIETTLGAARFHQRIGLYGLTLGMALEEGLCQIVEDAPGG